MMGIALCGCGGDAGPKELPMCARESYLGPAGQAKQSVETICGLVDAEAGWQIAGPGPIFDSKRTLVAMDMPLPDKSLEAKCELRDRAARIDDQWVWAKLVGMPGMYCKVRVSR